MNELELATIGANLESKFDDLAAHNIDHTIELTFNVEGQNDPCSYELTLVDKMEYVNETGDTVKALTFRDQDGNVYVHYRGTGDGNWDQNTVAYDGGPSEIQEISREYLDESIVKYGGTGNKIYVTGHSQGGNNAQYATMTSEYGDNVDMCVSLDGQGFSHENVERMKALYGEEYFEAQREKIYAVNGDADPVSTFGQEHIIPKGHERFIQTEVTKDSFRDCHDVNGMLNGTSLKPTTEDNDSAAFRKVIAELNERACDLPQEQQAIMSKKIMVVAEFFFDGPNGTNHIEDITEEDLVAIMEIVVPVLADMVAEEPELVKEMLRELGLPDYFVDTVAEFLQEFDELSESQKRAIYEALADCVTFTEDGQMVINAKLTTVLRGIFNALPAITETILDDPKGVYEILQQTGLLDKIEELIQEHPGAAVLISLFVMFNLDKILLFAGGIVLASYLLDFVRSVVDTLKEWGEAIKNFVANMVESIKKTIKKVKEYLHSLTPGAKYAKNNQYIKADTEKLRNYANRLEKINTRLKALDEDLDSLYWQVGLADLASLITTNMITSYSASLALAKKFLNQAAERLEEADNQACRYMGG